MLLTSRIQIDNSSGVTTKYGLERRCWGSYNKSMSVWVGIVFNILSLPFLCDSLLLDFPCDIRVMAIRITFQSFELKLVQIEFKSFPI